MKDQLKGIYQGILFFGLFGMTVMAQASVYVSNTGGNTVSIINPATNTVTTSPVVGSEPRNLAADAGGSFIYVPNRFSNSVSVISAASGAVVATVNDASFDEPYAAAVKGSEVWVVNKKGGGSSTGSVTVIDASTRTVVAVINDACFSSPEGVATNPAQTRAYVINRGNDTVCVVDTAARTVIGSAISVGSEPRYAVVSPSGAFVYVANNIGGNVTKIKTADNTTSVIATGGSPRNMDISAAGDKVYVALQNTQIAVINTADDSVSTIGFTASGFFNTYAVAIMPGTTRGFVTDESGDRVFVFDVGTEAQITGPGLPITGPFSTPRAIVAVADSASSPVPTLSVWAMAILVLLIAFFGMARLYRRIQS